MSATARSFSLSRRSFLAGGALLVTFSCAPRAFSQVVSGDSTATDGGTAASAASQNLKGSLKATPMLDAWIQIDAQSRITVFTGKAELGQGIRTALSQVAAEELDVAATNIELITVDTSRTPDEGLTAGSHSMQDSGTAIQNAAANVRMLLVQAAAAYWDVAEEMVTTSGDGHLHCADGRVAKYGDIAATLSLHVEAVADVPLRDPKQFRTIGTEMRRVDIPAKLTGGAAFVQDMRPSGMLHARVVRGPSAGTILEPIDIGAVEGMPGVVKVVQTGTFTAIVAQTEWTAILAQRRLQAAAFVRTAPALPVGDLVTTLQGMPAQDIKILDTHNPTSPAVRTVRARYTRPWLSHGSIGPSCAVALFDGDVMTVWTHSQGTFDVQRFVAELLNLPVGKVHAIHAEGAGCYGQNGADDAAADAAMIAKALTGRPIRLQWMREQEFGWEPLGPAMVTELEASLDAGHRIITWRHEIWSNRHNARPQTAGGVFVGAEILPPFPMPHGEPIPMPEGDGSRNSNPLYTLPNMHVVFHFIPDMPIRVSALRSLGAHMNVFSIESMFDELAKAAAVDPLVLRLSHMEDERARAVMQAATEQFGWSHRRPGDGRRGCGMAFARYKNIGAYCAVVMEIEVDRETGHIAVRRAVAAVDSGQTVNPDGVRNQIEGGVIQSLSWSRIERATFDANHRTSFDWSEYPILRFADVPDSIEVQIIDRPGLPFLGTGEASMGPTAAALANAFADATGIRLRDMPLSRERVKSAIGVT
jgi:CO/xanthine dehydrogenase Mo-binding subunit